MAIDKALNANTLQAPDPSGRGAEVLALAVASLGLALGIWLALGSDGYYHDDDATHYVFAIDGWTNPSAMWHVWARPGLTLPLALVGHWFGQVGCRLFSVLMTAITGYLSYRIARRILSAMPGGAYLAALAPALLWLQPLSATLAATTLTETPAALYLTLGVWLYLRGNRVSGCAVVSLAFVTRYEILALVPLFFVAACYDALRQSGGNVVAALKTRWLWACGLGLLAAPLAYMAVAWGLHLPASVSPLHMLDPGPSHIDEYGTGTWAHFLFNWLLAAGPGVLALWVAGAACFPRKAILPALVCVGLVAVETFLYHYGLFASGGYARFLVPIGGLTAAVAAVGLAGVLRYRRSVGGQAVFVALAGALLGTALCRPELLPAAWMQLGERSRATLGFFPFPPTSQAAAEFTALLATLLGGAIGVSALLRLSRGLFVERARLAMAILAITTATALMGVYEAYSVRPLMIADSTMHSLLRDTMARLDRMPQAGGSSSLPAAHDAIAARLAVTTMPDEQVDAASTASLSCHPVVVVTLLHKGARLCSAESAPAAWLNSCPGTLFVWENKYCGKPTAADPQGPLHTTLEKAGRLVLRTSNEQDVVEVYARVPDGERPSPADPATPPPADTPRP